MPTEYEARDLLNLPAQLFVELGNISARYGQAETILAMTIRRTEEITVEEAWQKVDALWYADRIRKEVKKAFRRWASDEFGSEEGTVRANKFSELIRKWKDYADRRDQVVHCHWSVKDDVLTGTRKGDLLQWNGHPVGIDDLRELADNLTRIMVQLNAMTWQQGKSAPVEDIPGERTRRSVIVPIYEREHAATGAAFTIESTAARWVNPQGPASGES